MPQAEVKNFVKRLHLPLTGVDIDAALGEIFLSSGDKINALEFVRKLKWWVHVAACLCDPSLPSP